METTKLSSKGQIVIPESFRKAFQVGTAFNVLKQNDLIVLKPIRGLTPQEIREMNELEKIWKEIDSGNCKSYSEEEFFEKMKKW